MSIATPASNSTLIQSQVQQLLVQPLEQASSFLAASPQLIDSNSPVRIPRIAQGATAAFTPAGTLIPDSGVDFNEIEALPSSLRAIKVWVPVSNELIRGSAVTGLDTVLSNRLITDCANRLDAGFFTGHSSGVNAVQHIVVDNDTDGTWTASFKGQTTAALDHDITTGNLQTALRGLSTIGASNVNVTGSAGDYSVTFVSALATQNVPLITVDGTSLVGTGATVVSSVVTVGQEPGGIHGILNQAGTQQAELDSEDLDSLLDAIALAHAENVQPNPDFSRNLRSAVCRYAKAPVLQGIIGLL